MWPFLCAIFILAVVDARGVPVVETNFGTVRGKWMASSERNISVAAYLGIPYATPPVGERRFQSPKAWTRNWTNIRDATADGSMCVQLDRDGNTLGSEDCLNLNIFVPLIVSKHKLPVLVYVHGGGFNVGSNNSTYFAPDYLMDHEIVVVTVNYRLGIFGFLSSATEKVPGNAGLKDIVEALNWIQSNIGNFGGDAEKVTLVGQSAGSAAVHHLALSKRTEGLFHQYITHSGSALSAWATHPPFYMRIRYLMIAKELGCTNDRAVLDFDNYANEIFDGQEDLDAYEKALEEDEKIVSCLRYASPSGLASTANIFHKWKFNPWCNFGPTVEIDSEDAIIIRHPKRTIELGELRDIPWITGIVADEGLLKGAEVFQNPELLTELNDSFDRNAAYIFENEEIIANTTAFSDALREFYFPREVKANELYEKNRQFTEMVGDGLITWPVYEALNYQAEVMNSSIYFYLFSYEGTFSSTYMHGIPRRYGVAHSDELNYLFPCLNNFYADLLLHNTENDWTMIHIMTELWSSFVKYGTPSARMTQDWESYQDNYRYMMIGNGRFPDIGMRDDFMPVRMGFWEYLMANVSKPMESLFLENLTEEDEPVELNDAVYSKGIFCQPFFSSIASLVSIFTMHTIFSS